MIVSKLVRPLVKVALCCVPLPRRKSSANAGLTLKEIKPALSELEANKKIGELLESAAGCMVARFGAVELGALLQYEYYLKLNLLQQLREWATKDAFPFSRKSFYQLSCNAGFFPINRRSLGDFHREMLGAMKEVDLLASWVSGEARFAEELAGAVPCDLTSIEPYYHQSPWSAHLEGKRILVIHPFVDTIRQQYEQRREHLFPGTKIIPKFDISYLKAVQSIAGTQTVHENWLAGLQWMTEEALGRDFEVAIIGCGAYGFPLAARLKRAGKKAIHLGGATQILFGIKGARWDAQPEIAKFYNEYWVRPSETERPQNADAVEGGCYW